MGRVGRSASSDDEDLDEWGDGENENETNDWYNMVRFAAGMAGIFFGRAMCICSS
jgi:hypothetical protein